MIDPNTGLYVEEPQTTNPGPLGGALQILNANRSAELASRSDTESLLKEHMMQLQDWEAQHKMERQIGYENEMNELSKQFSTSDKNFDPVAFAQKQLVVGSKYGEPPGAGSMATMAAFGSRAATTNVNEKRAEAQMALAKARQTLGDAAYIKSLGSVANVFGNMDVNLGTAIRMYPQLTGGKHLFPIEDEQAISSDPDVAGQPFSPEAHSKKLLNDAKAAVAPKVANARAAAEYAKAALDNARVSVVGGKVSGKSDLYKAQNAVDRLGKEILAVEHDLNMNGIMYSEKAKSGLQAHLEELKQELVDRKKQLDDLRIQSQQAPATGPVGANTNTMKTPGTKTWAQLAKEAGFGSTGQ